MAKYHELVEKYADRIAEIKAAQAKVTEMETRLDEAMNKVPYNLPEAYNASVEVEYARYKVSLLINTLDLNIQEEYSACPYPLAQAQGLEGFWRESGVYG